MTQVHGRLDLLPFLAILQTKEGAVDRTLGEALIQDVHDFMEGLLDYGALVLNRVGDNPEKVVVTIWPLLLGRADEARH